jgi:hypothetical protein
MFEMMKSFDFQKMPQPIKEKVIETFNDGNGLSNDSYYSWIVDKFHDSVVNNWLMANGGIFDEEILINIWW